ncbi:MAG: hypothetical protein ABSH02_12185 [Candidatus Sulfotelmatobacter sp.]|jgi:hypothetical protein
MSIFRLFSLSLVVVAGVATLTAQSSSDKIPAAIQSPDSSQVDSSARTDLLSPNLNAGLNPPNPLDRILIGDYRPHLSQFSVPHILRAYPEQGDGACLKMRTYKVARDGPHSDSTHSAGYTTCTPAARFQVHTAVLKVLPTTP